MGGGALGIGSFKRELFAEGLGDSVGAWRAPPGPIIPLIVAKEVPVLQSINPEDGSTVADLVPCILARTQYADLLPSLVVRTHPVSLVHAAARPANSAKVTRRRIDLIGDNMVVELLRIESPPYFWAVGNVATVSSRRAVIHPCISVECPVTLVT